MTNVLSDFTEASLLFFCSIYLRRTGTIGPFKNGGRRRFGSALGIALRLRRFVDYTASTQELAERGELLRRIVEDGTVAKSRAESESIALDRHQYFGERKAIGKFIELRVESNDRCEQLAFVWFSKDALAIAALRATGDSGTPPSLRARPRLFRGWVDSGASAPASWNQITAWLRRVDELRRAV